MLDSATKRRIDTARDILVGKVPDPKSQVEQITIALIYKFMDDMDAQAEEVGGKARKFFAGEFKKYGWANLMSPATAGEERIALYAEGMVKMPQNPGVPKFFRDIFKNAFLPYRDPETLKLFLKEIDGFTYDHSERLGDAFEYLLSVLGSQGDAGQFRTPRHIIDFIVKVVDPKKTDVILDPACGTAGFLISAYEHIVAENKGKPLTPDEKKRMAANLKGYDISPDMVRLSLVNLYLHGFTAPNIDEYDTLTSQDKWNETADVILANPPFMSPKGGIKPHDRFGVKSKRSEVLFVDYMAEHLTPTGRAGIIVPEGIIFQSQNSYVALRKMLVENYLVAVVSLPQGVFNPYSGVKTSILLFDKPRAKRSSGILFTKEFSDDGHDLGATRRHTGDGDLPAACSLIRRWCSAIDSGSDGMELLAADASHSIIVAKTEIAADGDWRLTADTYRKSKGYAGAGYDWATLGSLLQSSTSGKAGELQNLPVLSITMKSGLVDQGDKFKKRIASADISSYKRVSRNELVVGFPIDEGVLGIQRLYDEAAVSPAYDIWSIAQEQLDLDFFEKLIRSQHARARYRLKMRGTAGRRRTIDKRDFLEIEIPLPPLSVQKEIVAEIDHYQKVIDGARAVLDHYRPHIPIQPDWPLVRVENLAAVQGGIQKSPDRAPKDHHRPFLTVRNVQRGYLDLTDVERFEVTAAELTRLRLCRGDILIVEGNGSRDHIGRNAIFELNGEEWIHQNHVIRVRTDGTKAVARFVSLYLNSPPGHDQMLARAATTSGLHMLSVGKVQSLEIPLPPLPEQERIVAEIEAEQRLVAGNRELIERFERKIQQNLARVWGEPITTPIPEISAPTEVKSTTTDLFGGEDPTERYLRNAAAVAALVIRKLVKGNGKTFVEKNLHIVESYCDLPMGRHPRRMQHGPADLKQHDRIMDWAADKDIFLAEPTADGKRVTYTRGEAFISVVADVGNVLGDKQAAVESLVGKLSTLTSEQSEWVATAYGSWNDFIKAGTPKPTDPQIVKDIYTHWHVSKLEVPETDWRWALQWLRDNQIIPNGKGPKVEAK